LESAGLQILAVDVSNDVTRTREFYDGYGFTLPAGFDVDGSVSARFGVIATPTNYLVDAEGRIIWRHYGFRPGDEVELRAEIGAALGAVE
jgi:peroxiredoxin